MEVGDTVTVRWGDHVGACGTIAKLDATMAELVVGAGRIEVELDQLRPEDPLVAIANAVRDRRGHSWQLHRFWMAEAQRDPRRGDATLAIEYPKYCAPIERACDEAVAAELARWNAEIAGLDAEARDAKWQAERDQWTDCLYAASVAYDAVFDELLPDIPRHQRGADAHELNKAGYRLADRVAAYRAHTRLAEPIADELRNEELEREIEADVDRDAAFLVYADWLQSRGNRRGEWIALSAAGAPQAALLRAELAPQLLGPLAELTDQLAMRWRHGYLDALTLATTRDQRETGLSFVTLVRRALALPTCRFLRELTIVLPSKYDDVSVVDTLAAAGSRPSLRRLALVTNEDEEMLSWTHAGDLAPLAVLFPNLESLEVRAGGYELAEPVFPTLRRLVLQTCGAPPGIALAIARADWPLLEELELWFGAKRKEVDLAVDDLEPLLAAPLPKLRRLGLCNCDVTDALCERLLASPLLPRLERLSLANGTLTDAGAQLIVDNAARFAHLAALDVDQSYLGNSALEQLRAAGLAVVTSWQRRAEGEHYASVWE